MTQLATTYPLLRKVTIGAHVVLAAWLVINGLAHQIHVLIKAYAGTLRPGADLSSLLAVGMGLLVAGAIVSYSIAPLVRAVNPTMVPAFIGSAVLAVVTLAIAHAYGTTFLGGTIALGVLDVVLLTAHAAFNTSRA